MGSVYDRCEWCGGVIVDGAGSKILPMKPSFSVLGILGEILYGKKSLACHVCHSKIDNLLRLHFMYAIQKCEAEGWVSRTKEHAETVYNKACAAWESPDDIPF